MSAKANSQIPVPAPTDEPATIRSWLSRRRDDAHSQMFSRVLPEQDSKPRRDVVAFNSGT